MTDDDDDDDGRNETPLDDWDDTEELDEEAAEERERIRVSLGLAAAAHSRTIDDRYEILARQGQGGMGVVYRAHDSRLDRDVALKLVRSRPFSDEDRLRERLEREAKALAKLEGRDHVIAVYDVGRHQGRIYFTMPFVDGPNLREWQDERDRSVDAIIDVYLQAARGLAAAHELGIVHRDFKPGNVLVRNEDHRAMVADFGIAEAVSELDTPSGNGRPTVVDPQHLTATGAVLGTLPYVAPERIPETDQPVARATPASDQFSFCVALWEAVAGQVPFPSSTTAEMLVALERGPIGETRVPRWLRPVLRRGLARDPEARFSSMDTLIQTIQSRRFRRRKITLVGVGVALTLAMIRAAFMVSSPAPADEHLACSSFSDSAAAVWNEGRRAALVAQRGHAPETIDHVITQLDTLTQRWIAAAEETCVDGHAPKVDDPQRECLDQWLHVAGDYVELLAEIDAETAVRAGEVVDRLLPPDEGFCAFSPPQIVDFELWTLTESARAAAILGSGEQALVLADQAIEDAQTLAGGRLHTAELAEAHAARAEVSSRQGRYDDALRDFEVADAHAHVVGYLELEISARALWAKVRALGSKEAIEYDLALADLDRARPLVASIMPLDQQTRLEAELEDAAGFVEYQRDRYPEAVVRHQHAFELLSQLDLPVLLAKSLVNLGAAQRMLDQVDEAQASYEQARRVLDAAEVPLGHTTSVDVELHLGILAVDLDRSEGFDHLGTVVLHSSGARQLTALGQALTLATNLHDEKRMRQLADDLFERLADRPITSSSLVHAKFVLATALIGLGDPRGEGLFDELDELPAELASLGLRLAFRRSRVLALQDDGRCDDAAKRLTEVDDYARQHALVDDAFLEWHTTLESGDCKLAPFSNQ